MRAQLNFPWFHCEEEEKEEEETNRIRIWQMAIIFLKEKITSAYGSFLCICAGCQTDNDSNKARSI
jgi:hypothetical protein